MALMDLVQPFLAAKDVSVKGAGCPRGIKKREEVGHVTSQKPARYPIKYSRIDVIT